LALKLLATTVPLVPLVAPALLIEDIEVVDAMGAKVGDTWFADEPE
jgi:hypothetical protein